MHKTSLHDISARAEARVPDLSVSARAHDRNGPCAVVALAGRAGVADSGWLRLLLELQAGQVQGRVVVDLSRLSSMDWWVALMLTWAGRVVSRRGGELVLASPQPAVARLLDAVAPPPAAIAHRVHDGAAECPPAAAVAVR